MLIQFTTDRFGKLWQTDREGSSLTWEEWRTGADKAFDEIAEASGPTDAVRIMGAAGGAAGSDAA